MDMLRVSPVGVVETIVPSHGLTVACHGGGYLAATHPRRTHISLWRLSQQHDDSKQRKNESFNQMQWPLLPPPILTLSRNEAAVKALAFSKHRRFQSVTNDRKTNDQTDSILLCSVDDYSFVVWDLPRLFLEKYSLTDDVAISDTNNGFLLTLGNLLPQNEIENEEMVSHCCFSWDNRHIAVCRGNDIVLILLKTDADSDYNPTHLLKGHDSCVNSADFSPHRSTWLVSVADDYTFIVWDVAAKSGGNILQRSYIPSQTAIPLVVAMDSIGEYVSIATADGHLLLISLACAVPPTAADAKTIKITPAQKGTFSVVRAFDCSHLMQKETTITSTLCDSALNTVDSGCVILSVSYFYSKRFCPQQQETSTDDFHFISKKSFFENINQFLFLVVGTNKGILCLNAYTLECLAVIDLTQYENTLLGDFKTLSLMSMVQDFKDFHVNCITANHFDNSIHISKLSLPTQEKSLDKITDRLFDSNHEKRLVCPNTKLTTNSVLKLVSTCKNINKTNSKPNSSIKLSSPIKGDQPLTFKKTVKSSGYSAAPTNCTLFKPNTKATKKCPKSKCIARISAIQYDPTQVVYYNGKQKLSDNLTTAVTRVTFSSDGKDLAAAFTDGTAMTVKHSLLEKPILFMNHQSGLNSVNLSHNGRWLLTASNDKTACVWKTNNAKPLMTFEKISHNFKNEHFSLKKKTECFEKEIKSAQFYYMDNFVLLASGPSFYLYNYNIDPIKDDVKSYLVKNQYKLVEHFAVDANLVTDLAAVNFFYSYIVLCCTSDRSLCAYDMNVGKRILTIKDTHPTAPHSIVMNTGSGCLSLPASGYDLVLTAATTNGIKLWDLRSGQCVRRLDSHYNRSHQCRPAFSPCGKYVLAASENNTAYLYDIGEGVTCQQLARHSDIVTDVAYNPTQPQIITATLDGKLYSFNDKEIK